MCTPRVPAEAVPRPSDLKADGPLEPTTSGPRHAAGESVFKNAVCAVDGTDDSFSAIEHAGALVGPDGHLTLLIATSFRHEGYLRSPAISPAEASEIVQRARGLAEGTGASASVDVDPSAPPIELILRAADEHDLLALGAPAIHSWFGSIFMDSVTAIAEETLKSPLLISRAHEAWKGGAVQRLLVASDGLESSDGLVELAGRLASAQNAAVTLVHVLGAETRAHPHRVERQAADLHAELCVELGAPRNVIVDTARASDASLILMGSRRLGGLRALGSVSRPVAQHAHCPVLLMPPELLAAPQAA